MLAPATNTLTPLTGLPARLSGSRSVIRHRFSSGTGMESGPPSVRHSKQGDPGTGRNSSRWDNAAVVNLSVASGRMRVADLDPRE